MLSSSILFEKIRLYRFLVPQNVTSDISSSLSEFDAPFLVLHGKEDKVTDPKLSQALYDESKSKDKTIKLYDGKGALDQTSIAPKNPSTLFL
jgi:predicted esterase